MIDRVDLLIAVIGIVISVVGSSTALWLALSRKADKEDVAHVESRLDAKIDHLEARVDAKIDHLEAKILHLEARMDTGFARVESKLDALMLRFLPEQLPQPDS
ncbi:MAG: hypothetical protein LC792_24550 [Actinobacteria bacterium]|nr:hypothetical protein [Actinomycetota bacterium]